MTFTTFLGMLALIAYGYGLGAASVVVWRYYRGVLRYAPGVATLTYYLLALTVAHPPAYRAVLKGTDYPLPDVARNWASALAFGSALFLISRLVRQERGGK